MTRALVDLDRLGRLLVRVAELPDPVDDVEPADDLADDRVVRRELRVGGGDDEELAARPCRARSAPVFAIATTPCVYFAVVGGVSTVE